MMESIKKTFIKERLDRANPNLLKEELFYLECNPEISEYLLKLKELVKEPVKNENNSTIYWLMGLTDEEPTAFGIKRTPTTLPDIDYDTNARNEVKEYLKNKYGEEHVTLLGTYQTLKTKGAIKDVLRQLRSDLNFEFVNTLTKKFDAIKRTDTEQIRHTLESSGKDYSMLDGAWSSELAYFYAILEQDKTVNQFFVENPEVKTAVVGLLGNAKATGIHAGGIVVTSADLLRSIPMTFSEDEGTFVTQPEMGYVESSGLIKFDFLGLSTLDDINLTFKLIRERHGKNITFKDIPLDDEKVLDEFAKGNTTSIFQFNTNLSVSILNKLNKVNSINDLAIITSIARPGPLAMGMDQTFIKRANGEEAITHIHDFLAPILEDTYSIVVFQEQVMKIVQELGGLTGDESLSVLKGMGKKQLEKIMKYKEKFLANAVNVRGLKKEKADEIWSYLQAFAEYGFNKCLTLDTKVKTASGKSLTLNEIKEMDLEKEKVVLKSYDEKTGKLFNDRCLEFIDNGVIETYEIKLVDNRKVKCTIDHEFVCSDNKKHKLSEILKNDLEILYSSEGIIKKSKVLDSTPLGPENVACLRMESDSHNFLLDNGVVSGNSHAIAYSCVSYCSMWLKYYYPAEWISAVLSGAKKEDFKIYYQSWKDMIIPPDINLSGDMFTINADKKVIMPFSSINGVGTKVVEAIKECQPFTSVEDFFSRVDKRRVTKASMYNLVLSGSFDSLKPDVHYSENKWRKECIQKIIELREKLRKPSAKEKEENKLLLAELEKMTRGQMVMKEIALLNFTSFNYYDQFYKQMTDGSKKIFGTVALKPEEALTQPKDKMVVVGGAVESILFFTIKKEGKNKGKEMARITLANEDKKIDVVVFSSAIEQSDKGSGKIRKIKEFTPIIIKGKINHYNGNVSLVYEECWVLVT